MLVMHFSKIFQVDFANSVTIYPENKNIYPFQFVSLKHNHKQSSSVTQTAKFILQNDVVQRTSFNKLPDVPSTHNSLANQAVALWVHGCGMARLCSCQRTSNSLVVVTLATDVKKQRKLSA